MNNEGIKKLSQRLTIPPLFGRPKLQGKDLPSYIPSRMWLVPIDDDSLKALQIQTVPMELSVDPIAKWATIPSIGRNNPFYHYTGGEDSLKFTLDWYTVRDSNQDVIENCRWVESLARNNAYNQGPTRVLLIFGDLFQFDLWVVESAPYRLNLFNRERGMLPKQAYQELTLKKVIDKNTSRSEVRFYR
jgi:hypothetical protein